jgi:hypothetical protein
LLFSDQPEGTKEATVTLNRTSKIGNGSNRDLVRRANLGIAFLLSATLPIQVPGSHSISVGAVLALFLSPIIIPPVLTKMAWGRALGKSILLVVITASLLIPVSLSLDSSRSFSLAAATTASIIFVALVSQVISVAWASSHLGVARVALVYSAGAILYAAANHQYWSTNAWKYAFAWPVSVIVITILSKRPKSLQPVGIILAALYAITHESRNSAGALILALLATCATYLLYRRTEKRRGVLILVLMAGGALAISNLVTHLALNGDLGEKLQSVQVSQSSSGTPIPGRVEFGATFALMRHDPLGLGPGVVPSNVDIAVGKSGLSAIGASTSGDYVDGRMFGNGFEVHSLAGDLWVQFGLGGLFLAGLILAVLLRAIVLNQRSAPSKITALCAFLGIQAIWDLLFSPLYANFRSVGFATGVAIFLISTASSRRLDPSWTSVSHEPVRCADPMSRRSHPSLAEDAFRSANTRNQ